VIALIFAPREQEIRLPLGEMRGMVGYRTPEWESAIIDEYSNNLYRMCQLGRAFNFKFYAIFQPSILQKSPLSDAERKLKFGDSEYASYMQRQHDRVVAAFRQLQSGDGRDGTCRFVDLSQIFVNDPRGLFWDFFHLNNDGNATIASAIAANLVARLPP